MRHLSDLMPWHFQHIILLYFAYVCTRSHLPQMCLYVASAIVRSPAFTNPGGGCAVYLSIILWWLCIKLREDLIWYACFFSLYLLVDFFVDTFPGVFLCKRKTFYNTKWINGQWHGDSQGVRSHALSITENGNKQEKPSTTHANVQRK